MTVCGAGGVRPSISSARGQQKRASKQLGCWPKKLGIVARSARPGARVRGSKGAWDVGLL